jgi:hypothetical protein
VCACWVPKCLLEKHKNQHFEIALLHFQWFNDKRNKFLEATVAGNETCVHHLTHQTKQAGMQWKNTTFPTVKKFQVCQFAGEVMASVFWNAKGIIHTELMPQGTTINANTYCDTLQEQRNAVHKKRSGYLSLSMILQHDNLTPHSACWPQELLQLLHWKLLDHPPLHP